MIYDIFKYYNDELTAWNRMVEFCKKESREIVCKIAVGVDQQIISSAKGRESISFVDQFMEHEMKFDFITSQIISQQQRLERSTSNVSKPIEHSIRKQQNLLRVKIHSSEKNFIHTKYTCSIFLSAFINYRLSPIINVKAPTWAVKFKNDIVHSAIQLQ